MLLCGKLRIALVCRGERSTFLLHPSPFRTASESVMHVAADSWRPFSNRRYPKNEDKPVRDRPFRTHFGGEVSGK